MIYSLKLSFPPSVLMNNTFHCLCRFPLSLSLNHSFFFCFLSPTHTLARMHARTYTHASAHPSAHSHRYFLTEIGWFVNIWLCVYYFLKLYTLLFTISFILHLDAWILGNVKTNKLLFSWLIKKINWMRKTRIDNNTDIRKGEWPLKQLKYVYLSCSAISVKLRRWFLAANQTLSIAKTLTFFKHKVLSRIGYIPVMQRRYFKSKSILLSSYQFKAHRTTIFGCVYLTCDTPCRLTSRQTEWGEWIRSCFRKGLIM